MPESQSSSVIAMSIYDFLRTVLWMAVLSTTAAADLGLQPRPTCDPTKMSCAPDAQTKPCPPQNCLADSAAQVQFEKVNNCVFPASACGSFNKDTQCCGKDPRTGKPRVIDKVMNKKDVISPGLDSFTWVNYTMSCPNKKQNDAPPNALWQKCHVGKIHMPDDPDDYYKVTEVQENGTARPYCIEGCSIPPLVVATSKALGIFLPNGDRNNPSGYQTASFESACNSHDVCYQTCKDDQMTCDKRLKDDMIAACGVIPPAHETLTGFTIVGGVLLPKFNNTRQKCMDAANSMFTVLGPWKFGTPAFNLRRQQYCQCC